MGTYQLEVWLSVSHPAGTPVAPEDFAHSLGVEVGADQIPYIVYGLNSLWANARMWVCQLHLDDFSGDKEPTEVFFAAAEETFQQFARWLARLPANVFEDWQGRGFRLQVWVYAWIAQDQFELTVPHEMLAELGRLRLPLRMMTEGQ